MRRNKSKQMIRIFATVMAIVLLATCVPMSVFGASEDFPLSDVTDVTESTAGDAGGVSVSDGDTIVTGDVIGEYVEVLSRREENVKHFALPDGTYTAIVYPNAVHRKDADGVWQDIDNDLALLSVKGTQKYATADSRVSFSKSFSQSTELMTLSENGYAISMSLLRDNNAIISTETMSLSAPVITNSVKREIPKTDVKLEDVAKVDNKSSILYNNVRENTDIEYILDGNAVKENIIVRAASNNYEYTFDLRLDGLVALLNENGSISINDAETGEAKYIIPAPYMFDANGNTSTDVEYTLIEISSGRYLLAVTADKAWINTAGRAFPVTIDPTVDPKFIVSDTYICENNPDEAYFASPELCVCYNCTALINLYLPTLPENSSIIGANMIFNYYFGRYEPDMSEIGVYQITSSWSEEITTYNSAPSISSTQISSIYLYLDEFDADETGEGSLDITELVYDWYYEDVPNNGIALKFESGIYEVKIKSYDSGEGNYEYISIEYAYDFEEGVYAFRNVIFENNWMTTDNGILQHEYLTQSPMLSFATDQSEDIRMKLFKVSKQGSTGRYVIRSMANNRNVLTFDDNKFMFIDLPVSDENVPIGHTFFIYEGEWGLLLRSSRSGERYIGIEDTTTYDLVDLTEEQSQYRIYWEFEEYNGIHKYDFEIDDTTFGVEVKHTVTPKYWSTHIDCNVPKLELSDDHYYDDVDWIWNDDTGSASATFYVLGTFELEWEIKGGNWPDGTITVESVPSFPDEEDIDKILNIKIYYDSSVLDNEANCEYTHEEILEIFDRVNWYFYKEFGFIFKVQNCALSTQLDLPGTCFKTDIDNIPICNCGGNSENHHTSNERLTNLLKSDGDYYVLRLVGYGLCGIHDGEHNETVILGSAYVKGKDSVCSTTRSKLALEHVIIHELSHNLGAHHDEDKSGACNDAFCVMSREPNKNLPFYEDVWIDYWCSTCKSNIEDTLFPDDTY